jgi:hypothetical protein
MSCFNRLQSIAALLLAFSVALPMARTQAQDAAPLLEQWLGDWRGPGTNSGAPAQLHLNWERALGGRFVRLTLVNEIGAHSPLQRFEGLAMYWPASRSRLNGRWFDSEGSAHVLDGVLDTDALVSEWGDGTIARGRSTYQLLEQNVMEVIDEIKRKDGTWREFGRYRLTRVAS